MKAMLAAALLGAASLGASLSMSPAAHASVLVGQCVEFSACYNNVVPFSTTVSESELAALGLGSTQPFTAAQTSQFIVQLGPTSFDFSTLTGSVTEDVGDFTGGYHTDPCNGYCEVDTVADISIPSDATGLTVSGSFGGNGVGSSAGVNLYLGPVTSAAPEPSTWILMIAGIGGIGFMLRQANAGVGRRIRRALAA